MNLNGIIGLALSYAFDTCAAARRSLRPVSRRCRRISVASQRKAAEVAAPGYPEFRTRTLSPGSALDDGPRLGFGDSGRGLQCRDRDVDLGDVAVAPIPGDAGVQHVALAVDQAPRHLGDGEANGIFSMSHKGKSAGITVMRCRTRLQRGPSSSSTAASSFLFLAVSLGSASKTSVGT